MFGKVSRFIVSVSVAALLASCNSLGVGGESSKAEAPTQPNGNAQIMPLAPQNPSSSDQADRHRRQCFRHRAAGRAGFVPADFHA